MYINQISVSRFLFLLSMKSYVDQLFDSSFRNKCLPSEWKYANITPLYKKGSRSDPGNYRPVSLTSIVCKLMESIIRDSVTTHFKLKKNYLAINSLVL